MNKASKIKIIFLIFFLVSTFSLSIAAEGMRESSSESDTTEAMSVKERMNKRLDTDAFRVIELKDTERPFTGDYWDNHEDGTYVCRRCGEPLYKSSDKFDSNCGWPSFDDEIEGAVRRQIDADGHRAEILCNTCDAHLGHVFLGEKLTDKDTRHCVNSLSMRFVPTSGETGRAVFAGGCFWGVEYFFNKVDGVKDVTSGYTGGSTKYPTYKEVCNDDTGHLEVVEVLYDPEIVSYRELAKLFFEIHDPSQSNGQGPDIGDQYLSVVFYENADQRKTTEELIAILNEKGMNVATSILPAAAFWPAEDYHQDYYAKNGKSPYCHSYTSRFQEDN
ncbi:MAG: bifunctional methionine sulfoxide reductase B/A protein [Spirochaetales bacterium]|nr:bifunctional methionine sulfoxide reductase B/A protein [Spirochaetales bacterium]